MPKIILTTGKPIDGEYPLDINQFTFRERAYITEVSGTLPPEFIKKWFEHDPLTVLATTGVMVMRAGKIFDLESLLDVDDKAITIDYSDLLDEEEEAEENDPPAEASPPSDDATEEKPAESETGG